MQHNLDNQVLAFLKTIYESLRDAILGASAGGLGHVVRYSHTKYVLKENTAFNIALFIIKILSGGFIGWIVGNELPPTTPFRDFIISVAGITGFTLIVVMDSQGAKLLLNRILGISINTDEIKKDKK